eukprot:2175216-Lingulodinium_polyedra.AAC.1
MHSATLAGCYTLNAVQIRAHGTTLRPRPSQAAGQAGANNNGHAPRQQANGRAPRGQHKLRRTR